MSTNIDHLMDEPRPEPVAEVEDARLSQEMLYVDDDMGTVTKIRVLHAETWLAIRRAVRELNPGSIPIYSPYDCTGKLCHQSCTMLKLYRNYDGSKVAVVEIRKTFDV